MDVGDEEDEGEDSQEHGEGGTGGRLMQSCASWLTAVLAGIACLSLLARGAMAPVEVAHWPRCQVVRRHIRVQFGNCPQGWYAVRASGKMKPGTYVNDTDRRNPVKQPECDVANASRFARECGLFLPRIKFARDVDPNCSKACRARRALPSQPVESCAIVGSGGSLLDSFCGKEIDRHKVVMRVNLPVLAGHERDVGSKMTHAVLNSALTKDMIEMAIAHEKNRVLRPTNATLYDRLERISGATVISLAQDQAVHYLMKKMRHRGSWGYFNTSYIYMPRKLYRLRHYELWRLAISDSRHGTISRAPTTGMLAMAIAASMCKNVYMYGYKSPTRAGEPYHYWEPATPYFLQLAGEKHHNFNLEHDILDILADAPKPAVCVESGPEYAQAPPGGVASLHGPATTSGHRRARRLKRDVRLRT